MSVYRTFAQRNNNNTSVVPEYAGVLPNSSNLGPYSGIDLYNCGVYNLTIPNVQNGGGIYCIDLSGNDSSGNPLNVGGQLRSLINNSNYIPAIAFGVTVPYNAAYAPGLEFTVFFKNIPYDRINGPPFLTLGIVAFNGAPIPYIFSAPVPQVLGPNINASVTFKSDGQNFNIVSSGPAGWLGPLNIEYLITAVTEFIG